MSFSGSIYLEKGINVFAFVFFEKIEKLSLFELSELSEELLSLLVRGLRILVDLKELYLLKLRAYSP
jgi:hypothetical protein